MLFTPQAVESDEARADAPETPGTRARSLDFDDALRRFLAGGVDQLTGRERAVLFVVFALVIISVTFLVIELSYSLF